MQWNNKQTNEARILIALSAELSFAQPALGSLALALVCVCAAAWIIDDETQHSGNSGSLIIYLNNERRNKADCSVIVRFKLGLMFDAPPGRSRSVGRPKEQEENGLNALLRHA
jgi:hypothetical protein